MKIKKMEVPVKLGIKGRVKAILTDVRDGSQEVREFDNMLLDDWLDAFFTVEDRCHFRITSLMNTCIIGDGTTGPQRSDTSLSGSSLASSSAGETLEDFPDGGTFTHTIISTQGSDCPRYGMMASPDGTYLVGSWDWNWPGGVKIWERQSDGSYSRVATWSLAFGENNTMRTIPGATDDIKYIASARTQVASPYIYERNDETGAYNQLSVTETFSEYIRQFVFIEGSDYIVCAGENPTLALLEKVDVGGGVIEYHQVTSPFSELPGDIVYMIDKNSAEDLFVFAAHDGLYVYERSGTTFTRVADPFDDLPSARYYGVSISADGDIIAALSSVADVADGMLIWKKGTTQYERMDFAKPSMGAPVASTIYRQRLRVVKIGDDYYILAAMNPHLQLYKIDDSDNNVYLASLGYNMVAHSNGIVTTAEREILSEQQLNMFKNIDTQALSHSDFISTGIKNQANLSRKWTFDAGIGTGTVGEVALRYTGPANWVARQVLDPVWEKTEFHRLEVIWTLSITKDAQWSGTIVDGQRDGITDINWTAYLTNEMFSRFVKSGHTTGPIRRWLGFTAGRAIWLNNWAPDIDLQFTGPYGFAPTEFQAVDIDGHTVEDYVPGSYEREFTMLLDTPNGNDPESVGIASMLLTRYATVNGNQPDPLVGVQFDPPLDKVDTYRMYIKFKFALDPS